MAPLDSGLIFHSFLPSPSLPLTTASHKPRLLTWPLSQLFHPPFTHTYPDKLQALIWLSFFSSANHTSQAQMSSKCLSGSLPLLLLTYYLTHAQMSHSCSSAHMFYFSPLYHPCHSLRTSYKPRTSHKCLSELIFYSSLPLSPSLPAYYLMQAQKSHSCSSGLIFHFCSPSPSFSLTWNLTQA
jgi:hypothetical protein